LKGKDFEVNARFLQFEITFSFQPYKNTTYPASNPLNRQEAYKKTFKLKRNPAEELNILVLNNR
jgi:hypothetical protein